MYLIIRRHRRNLDEPLLAEKLSTDYAFLIPKDARRVIELCALVRETFPSSELEGNHPTVRHSSLQKDQILLAFAGIWRGHLEAKGLAPSMLESWIADGRIGVRILNHLITDPYLPEVALRLDPRTDDNELNLVIAFIRFTVEANLDAFSHPGVLRLGLDFCVLAHYLQILNNQAEWTTFRKEAELHLLDSPRKLYQRMLPLVEQRLGLVPGIVPVNAKPAALELFLDMNDPSHTAAWRLVLGDPEVADWPDVQNDAKKRCLEYLKQGKKSSNGTWREVSGFRWATRYLPALYQFDKPGTSGEKTKVLFENLFPEHCIRRSNDHQAGIKIDPGFGTKLKVFYSEMVTSPNLFHSLAGAFPRFVFQCWSMHGHEHTFLTPWQGLTLVLRVVTRVDEFFRSQTSGSSLDGPTPLSTGQVEQLKQSILKALEEHIGILRGKARSPQKPVASKDGSLYFGLSAFEGVSSDLARLAEDQRLAMNPLDFFPKFGTHGLPWLEPVLERRNDNFNAPWPGMQSFYRWYFPEDKHIQNDCEKIKSWNDLQAAKSQAWDQTLDRLASAITEWALFWAGFFLLPSAVAGDEAGGSRGPKRAGFDDIQQVFTTFLDDLGNEIEFAGTWSGAGDLIQRWVLTFLNSVLVHTLEPPKDRHYRQGNPKPQLLRSDHQRFPGRAADEGCDHALYQNLTRLMLQDKQLDAGNNRKDLKERQLDPEQHWHWSQEFLALASFPLLGLFLRTGGPLKDIFAHVASRTLSDRPREQLSESSHPEDGSRSTLPASPTHEDGHGLHAWVEYLYPDPINPGLDAIGYFGGLLLLPLHYWRPGEKGFMERADATYELDLAGLSWCGLDLRHPKRGDPLAKEEDRRDGLLAMLNSLAAHVPPCNEAKAHVAPLVQAVYGALKKETTGLDNA